MSLQLSYLTIDVPTDVVGMDDWPSYDTTWVIWLVGVSKFPHNRGKISKCIHRFLQDVITHPYHKWYIDFAKMSLKVRHAWLKDILDATSYSCPQIVAD